LLTGLTIAVIFNTKYQGHPWVEPSKLNYAVRTDAKIPRCTGYIPENPQTDPYTPFYYRISRG
jgi:hypothetical protein